MDTQHTPQQEITLLSSKRIDETSETLEAFAPSISVQSTDYAARNIPTKIAQSMGLNSQNKKQYPPGLYIGTNWIVQRSGNTCLEKPWPAIDYYCLRVRERPQTFRSACVFVSASEHKRRRHYANRIFRSHWPLFLRKGDLGYEEKIRRKCYAMHGCPR